MSARVIVIFILAVAVLVFSAGGLSRHLLERTISGPAQYTERSRCEYSPKADVLAALRPQERVPYKICEFLDECEIGVTATETARRYHDPSTVKDC